MEEDDGSSLAEDDFYTLKNQIAVAVEELDEMRLSELIDKARALGPAYRWQDELDQAESAHYEMVCQNASPLQFMAPPGMTMNQQE